MNFIRYEGTSDDYCSGDTVLHTLIYNNDVEEIIDIVPELVKAGANIFEKNDWSHSLLHYAAGQEDGSPLVEYFLQNGLGINERDKNGLTPLNHAIITHEMTGYIDTIECLLEHGADTNLLNACDGSNAFISSVATYDFYKCPTEKELSNFGNITMLLIKYGFNINTQDDKGMSALHSYLKWQHGCETSDNLLTVEKFVELGISPDLRNNNNKLASDIAPLNFLNCREYLKSVENDILGPKCAYKVT